MFKAHHVPPLAVLVLVTALGVAHSSFAQVRAESDGVTSVIGVEKTSDGEKSDADSDTRTENARSLFNNFVSKASSNSGKRLSRDKSGADAIGKVFQALQNINTGNSSFREAFQAESDSEDSERQIPQIIATVIASSSAVVPNAAAERVMLGVLNQDTSETAKTVKLIEDVRSGGEEKSTAVKQIQEVISQISHTASSSPVPTPSAIKEILNIVIEAAPLPPRKSEDKVNRNESVQNAVLPVSVQPEVTTSEGKGDLTPLPPASTSVADASPAAIVPVPVPQPVPPAEKVSRLEKLGQAIHTIRAERTSVEEKINTFVAQNVEKTVKEAASRVPITPAPAPGKVFDPAQREKIIADITDKATERGNQIAAQLTQSVSGGIVEPQSFDPVLKSSLQDIAALVQSESGRPVSITPGSRQIAQEIGAATQHIEETQKVLAQRDGLALYRDSDKDGISDYDEVHIYHTDSNNAYTAGGKLTDGERILLGLDPHTTSGSLVPVQSPKDAGVETKSLFEVTSIAVVSQPASVAAVAAPVKNQSSEAGGVQAPAVVSDSATTGTSPASVQTPAAAPATPVTSGQSAPQEIRFSGRALPNSFVTLYIYSTPIAVTVKTDANGLWTYTLDKQLEDGSHELYVATVDDAGKILAKSAPIPFTKQAEALDYQPLVIQAVSDVSPFDIIRQHLFVASGVLILLFAMVALLTVGFRREQPLAL